MAENEREELHRAIWAIADELRGSVDGWDFNRMQEEVPLLKWGMNSVVPKRTKAQNMIKSVENIKD